MQKCTYEVILTQSEDTNLTRASLFRFKKEFVLKHSAAFSPMYAIQRSTSCFAPLPPATIRKLGLLILTQKEGKKETNYEEKKYDAVITSACICELKVLFSDDE